jgi:hypothetical protein
MICYLIGNSAMHSFTELVDRCTTFTLNALGDANVRTVEALQVSGATTLVKTLQMIQLQKAIFAVGMFSMFEATLQECLKCKNGFLQAKKILEREKESILKERFDNFYLAINVLKHGHGDSYRALIDKAASLPFRVKLPTEAFFFEGDVSEVSTLIEVDDSFVLACASVIRDVSDKVIRLQSESA